MLKQLDGIQKNRGDCSNSKRTLAQNVEVDMIFEALFGNVIAKYFMRSLINPNLDSLVIKFGTLSSIITFQCQEIVKYTLYIIYYICIYINYLYIIYVYI